MIKSVDLLQVFTPCDICCCYLKWRQFLIYFHENGLINADHYNSNVRSDGVVGHKSEGRYIPYL